MDRFASMHDEDIDKLGIPNQVSHDNLPMFISAIGSPRNKL